MCTHIEACFFVCTQRAWARASVCVCAWRDKSKIVETRDEENRAVVIRSYCSLCVVIVGPAADMEARPPQSVT